ncbi:hypothetical protein Fcan01_24355 [Folsomia candida]|uniref:Uncharacterized protein n=1 Tax=Folsomia candida TaxID=158441 RepID=A0A226D7Q6_FOLCA|nr:hypothetical protein Fcan01_24355 [Folsomia candida]
MAVLPVKNSDGRDTVFKKDAPGSQNLTKFETPIDQTICYNFPHYFKTLFNFMFILGLSPFWISFHPDNKIKLSANKVQKLVVFTHYLVLCFFSVMTTRRQFTDNIGIHPEMIFELANFFFWGSYTFLVANTVWFKKNEVKELLQLPRKILRLEARILAIVLSLLVPIITILDYLQFTFFDENLNPVPVLDNFMEKLAKTFGTNNSTIYWFSETCWGTKVIVGIAFIIDFNWYFLSILGQVFVLISAVAAWEAGPGYCGEFFQEKCWRQRVNFLALISSFTEDNVGTLRGISRQRLTMLDRFGTMKGIIGKINALNNSYLLVTFLLIVSYGAATFVEAMNNVRLAFKLQLIEYYSFYFAILGFAAEAHLKATHIQRHIIMKEVGNVKFHGTSSTGNSLVYVNEFMKNSPGQDGLTGGKFFLVSYGFLGTTATIFLTYVLVMIQFKAASPSCNETTGH